MQGWELLPSAQRVTPHERAHRLPGGHDASAVAAAERRAVLAGLGAQSRPHAHPQAVPEASKRSGNRTRGRRVSVASQARAQHSALRAMDERALRELAAELLHEGDVRPPVDEQLHSDSASLYSSIESRMVA